MLLTICTIRQLPQAYALADNFRLFSPKSTDQSNAVIIGLADDHIQLPAGFVSPYPILPVGELLSVDELNTLSATYTPTEFVAAVKPLFIKEVFRQYPHAETVVYADPNIHFFGALTPIYEQLTNTNAILTPHITQRLESSDTYWPDEKAFQNVGLYSADFMAFRRSTETDRLLNWWDDRVRSRAYINFCEGLCTDQIWLMHMPVYFQNVKIVRNPGWHVALWNFPERTLRQENNNWRVDGPAGGNENVLFVNFKGLHNPDEGFFPHQTRLRPAKRVDVTSLLTTYHQALSLQKLPKLATIKPAFGQKPEPVVLRGWRYVTVKSLRSITGFISNVPLPVIR
ncbi:hypothetical protein GCM10028807_33380 [Spirosoma daeguense]